MPDVTDAARAPRTIVAEHGRQARGPLSGGYYRLMRIRPRTVDKAHLWLWCVNQHVDWGYLVARAWGFEPQQTITWVKTSRYGGRPVLGVGRFQANTEQVLVCRKGGPVDNAFGPTGGTALLAPRGARHSEKPAEFFALVERASPGPYLELFARRRRPGWDAWGDEAPPP